MASSSDSTISRLNNGLESRHVVRRELGERGGAMRRIASTLTLVLTIQGIPLHAQISASPEPGDRVRIFSAERFGDYRVSELQDESLVLRPESEFASFEVRTASLERLEVYRGKTSRLRGFVFGGLAGFVLGTTVAVPCTAAAHFTCESIPAGRRILLGVGAGSLAGLFFWGGREVRHEIRPGARFVSITDPKSGGGGLPVATADRIIQAELADLYDLDAYEAVWRLRRSWLRARPGTFRLRRPILYVDGVRSGGLQELRSLRATEVTGVERLSAGEATVQFGTGHQGGAILVSTR